MTAALGMAFFQHQACLGAQGFVEFGPQALLGPDAQRIVGRAAGGEVLGEHRPLAACFEHVADGVQASRRGVGITHPAASTPGVGGVDDGLDEFPLRIAEIGMVTGWLIELGCHCLCFASLAPTICRIGSKSLSGK